MMKDITRKVLTDARETLNIADISNGEREILFKFMGILSTSIEKFSSNNSDVLGLPQQIINNHALLNMLKEQSEELEALKKLSIKLTSSLDLPDVLDSLVSEAMQIIPNTRDVHIFLYDNNSLAFAASLDSDGNKNKPLAQPRKNGLTYNVARSGNTIIVENIRDHPIFTTGPKEWSGSIVSIPLKVGDTVVGVMNLARMLPGEFTTTDMRLLQLLSDQAAVAISNAHLHQLISRQAYTDTLTGLPNRRALDERLEQEIQSARKNNYSFAVVMMDLDGFKDINDAHGHAIGDDILRQVFTQMARGVRNTDFLARYGGDELTLILTQSDIASARTVVDKIAQGMQTIKLDLPSRKKTKLSVSGGIALFPLHARNGPDLLRSADAALYQAKKHNRGTFQVARGITAPFTRHNLGSSEN